MGNLYRTEEIKDIIDKELDKEIMRIAKNEDCSDAEIIGTAIQRVRALRLHAEMLIAHLEKLDKEHDIEMEKWRKEREANGGT